MADAGPPPLAQRHGGESRVDAVEEPGPTGGAILDQGQPNLRRPDSLQLPHVLRAVQAASGHGDLVKRLPDRWVEHAAVQGERRGGRIEASAAIELERTPGDQPFLPEQLPEAARVARDPERLLGRPARSLMLAMAVPRRSAEDRSR